MLEPTRDRAPTSVAENIEKMAQVENDALRPRTHRAAITDAIGGFAGTIYFVVLQLVVFGGWVLPGLRPFDPFAYPLLSSITSLEAVLLAAFVLIKQNRISTVADRRDHLDLQVNLLTERETNPDHSDARSIERPSGHRAAPGRRQPRDGSAHCY
jgi:uncharacterized membrane protein